MGRCSELLTRLCHRNISISMQLSAVLRLLPLPVSTYPHLHLPPLPKHTSPPLLLCHRQFTTHRQPPPSPAPSRQTFRPLSIQSQHPSSIHIPTPALASSTSSTKPYLARKSISRNCGSLPIIRVSSSISLRTKGQTFYLRLRAPCSETPWPLLAVLYIRFLFFRESMEWDG